MIHNEIQLRPAQAEDAPTLRSILHAAFEEYRGQLDPPSGVHHESLDTVLQKLQEGGAFLASHAGTPVGYVFYEVHSDYVYLGRLSVLPAHRKHGIARALIGCVEQQARDLHLTRVQLGTRIVLTHLQALYTRLGYQVIRSVAHEGYTEPTYVIMEKDLSNPQHG